MLAKLSRGSQVTHQPSPPPIRFAFNDIIYLSLVDKQDFLVVFGRGTVLCHHVEIEGAALDQRLVGSGLSNLEGRREREREQSNQISRKAS